MTVTFDKPLELRSRSSLPKSMAVTVGVLALQGAFSEHIQLLRAASSKLHGSETEWSFREIRTAAELDACDALVIPGGESTTMSLVAARTGLLDDLRNFVKVKRKPTWGTCAGLILLSESTNRTKKGGQELIGGLDVRVRRNHFGRQVESFTQPLHLPFLSNGASATKYPAVFIRAPIVEKVLSRVEGKQIEEEQRDDTVVAPSLKADANVSEDVLKGEVEVLASLPVQDGDNQIVAVRQGNCFGTSFHPELTEDARIHIWWLQEVLRALNR